MIENSLFFSLLLLQCGLVGWYLPRLLYKRMRRVITEYPPSEYPLLYPKPEAKYHLFHKRFKLAWQSIFGMSLVILLLAMLDGVNLEEGIWTLLPWALFMFQMIPCALVEVSEFSHARLLREKNTKKVRIAGMQSRNLLDLIPKSLFVTWLLVQVLCVVAIGWTSDFQLVVGDSVFFSILIILLANVAGAIYLRKLVSGKYQDPHQDPDDKYRASQGTAKSMFYISIGVSLFGAVTRLTSHFDADSLEPIIMCIYCQLIALVSIPTMLNATRLEQLNFEVYRKV